jgi:hypothetical protein
MMYILSPIPDNDNHFLQVVDTAGKRVEEYKRRREGISGEQHPTNSIDKSITKEK